MPTFDDVSAKEGAHPLHWIYVHRRGLAPVWVCILGWLTGLGLHTLVEIGPANPLLVLLGVVTTAVITITAAHQLANDTQVARKITLLTLYAMVWLAVALWVRPWQPAMVWSWVLGVFAGAIGWWTNARLRSRVKAESMIDAWPKHAKALHLDGSKMPRALFRVTASGWRAKITDADSEVVLKQIGAIAAKYGLRRGRLEGKHTDRADITELIYNDTDANPGGTELTDPDIRSIADEFVAGYQPNGKPFLLRLFDPAWGARHMLVAGMNGSGKSNFLNMIIAHIVKSVDAIPWLIDLKGGQEFGHWTKATRGGGWLAVDKAEAVNMVRELIRLIEGRAKESRRLWRSKIWRPSRTHPLICAVIDECAEMTGDRDLQEALDKLKSITRRARSCGVLLIYATQLPTNEAIGSTQIKAQMWYRICFRMGKKAEARHVLNQYDGVDVSALPGAEPGNFYGEIADEAPIRVRASYVADDTIYRLAEELGPEQSELDNDTAEYLTDRFFERERDPLDELTPEEFDAWFGMESENRDGEGDGGDGGDSRGDYDGDNQDGDVGMSERDREPRSRQRGDSDGDGVPIADRLASRPRGRATGTGRGTDGDTRPRRDGDAGSGAVPVPRRVAGQIPVTPGELFDDEFPPVGLETRIAGVTLPDAPAASTARKLTPEEVDEVWLRTFQEAGIQGVEPKQLADATGLHRSTVHRRIEEWLNSSRIERVRSGVYVLIQVGQRQAR